MPRRGSDLPQYYDDRASRYINWGTRMMQVPAAIGGAYLGYTAGDNIRYNADSDAVKSILRKRPKGHKRKAYPLPWHKSKRTKGPMKPLPPLPARERRLVQYNRSLYSQGRSGGIMKRLPIKKSMAYSRRSRSSYGRKNRNSVNSTRVMRKRRHKRKRKSRKSALSARQKRSVKAVVRYSEVWGPANTTQRTSFQQRVSAVNKVQWQLFGILHGATQIDKDVLIALMSSTFKFFSTSTLTDAQSQLNYGIVNAGDATKLYNKKMQLQCSANIKMVNTSNSCANIIFYLIKCVDHTSTDPLVELQALRNARFSNGSTAALEDSFDQYWSVPGSKALRKFKLAKKWKITLNGGQTANLRYKVPAMVFNPDYNVAAGGNNFYKGQYLMLTRIVGNLCHTDTSTIINIANTVVDFQIQSQTILKLSGDGTQQVKPHQRFANFGLGVAGTPNIANQEKVGVGTFVD